MNDQRFHQDDQQLPWLQAVDDEEEPRGVSARRMLGFLTMVLIAAALVGASFFYLGRMNAAGEGPPELIPAPPGPYKVRPDDPGGLDVSGESRTAFETSAGEDRDSQLDLDSVPEQPIAPPVREEPKRLPGNETRVPLPPEGAPPPVKTGAAGSVIQLGAFQNQAQAERAWSALSARFPSVGAMNKLIVPFSGGIRLRAAAASAAEARAACQALRAAGENCFVAN
jgi:hypothetical protein